MKITKIEIKDFHQFKDFSIDLTYPKGHEKEGKPLDKVCFIGQSGTGKTTLLELIPYIIYQYSTNVIRNLKDFKSLDKNIEFFFTSGSNNRYSYSLFMYCFEDLPRQLMRNLQLDGKEHLDSQQGTKEYILWITSELQKLIYFPANLNYSIDLDTESNIEDEKVIDFSQDKISTIWKIILEKVRNYQEQELKIRQDISKVVEKSSSDIKAIQDSVKRLEEWKAQEFNPIKDIADKCLNPLLSNYKLRVKTEFDFNSKEDIGFIKIEDFGGNEIPHGLWSTGTKQVTLSALPLYLLKPKSSIILFDEPERSLYPDLQRTIVDYYSTLTEDCQFFYSTHSPIIASSFEPWEIVELKFNNEGKVYRELYYEGENHVDNYKWNPKYMRWDDILQRIFDLEDDGSPERRKKLDELATLNVKYKKLVKQQKDKEPAAVEILEEITKLSKELSKWD